MRTAGRASSPAPAIIPGTPEEPPGQQDDNVTLAGPSEELLQGLRSMIRAEFVSLAPEFCSRIAEGLDNRMETRRPRPLQSWRLSDAAAPAAPTSRLSAEQRISDATGTVSTGQTSSTVTGQNPGQGSPWSRLKSFKISEELHGPIIASRQTITHRSSTWQEHQHHQVHAQESKGSLVSGKDNSRKTKGKRRQSRVMSALLGRINRLNSTLSRISIASKPGRKSTPVQPPAASSPPAAPAATDRWATPHKEWEVQQGAIKQPSTPAGAPREMQVGMQVRQVSEGSGEGYPSDVGPTSPGSVGPATEKPIVEKGTSSLNLATSEAHQNESFCDPSHFESKHVIDSDDSDDGDYVYNKPTLLRGVTKRMEEAVRARMARVVSSYTFDLAVAVVVVLNAIAIGVQTNWVASNLTDDIPTWMRTVELSFFACFILEIGVRFAALGFDMFRLPGWEWNAFDCCVVGLQLAEEVLGIIEDTTGSGSQIPSFGAMRVLRILRLIRIVRFVRIMRLIGELRTLITSITSSMRCLFWSLILIGVTIYMVGVFFVQVVSDHRIDSAVEVDEELVEFFGTLGKSVLSLFEAITGGINWHNVASKLGHDISPLLTWVFVFYIAFAVLALLNVVTGIFVQTATIKAKDQDDLFMINNVLDLFQHGSGGTGGVMSISDFERQLETPKMLDYFRSIDIDPAEARALFSLLDVNNDGVIDSEEFLNGCLHLRGPARALDLQVLMRELLALKESFRDHSEWLERIACAGGADPHLSASAPFIGKNTRTRMPQGHRYRRASIPDE